MNQEKNDNLNCRIMRGILIVVAYIFTVCSYLLGKIKFSNGAKV